MHTLQSTKTRIGLVATLGLGLIETAAYAAPITFTASSGPRAASATFRTSGTDLIITLENTSTADVLVPDQILTALFFDVTGGSLALAPVNAVLPGGSTVWFGGTDSGGVVGGEWAYRSGLSGPLGTNYGISSSGLDLFGPGDRFPGSNLQGPASPNGLQYGITSFGDDPTTGNTPVTGTNALIHSAVEFRFSGLPSGFAPEAVIQNVVFQYGTSLSEPFIPEPASLLLLAPAALVAVRRRPSRG